MKAISSDWKAIRDAAVAGVSFPQLAKRFGVTLSAIKKRSSREEWPIPARIMRRARELSQQPSNAAETVSAEMLAQIGQQNALLVARETARLVAKAFRSGLIEAPDNWTDLATANKLVRLSTGQDRESTNMQIQIGCLFRPINIQEDCLIVDTELMEAPNQV